MDIANNLLILFLLQRIAHKKSYVETANNLQKKIIFT